MEPQAPPSGRKFPCSQCGARLDFDPTQRALKCPYCGHVEQIASSIDEVKERDYEEYFHNVAGKETTLEGRSTEVQCPGCGAVVLLEDKVVTDRCPYCATHLENQPVTAKDMIAPDSVLPFKVSERDAIARFNDWVGSRWFAPNDLKNLANLGKLNGVYVPYWTYDSMTYTHYTGQRGDNYTVMVTVTVDETYVTTDSDGQTVTRTRPVTKQVPETRIQWTSVAGEVDHFFDDVLICASHSLPRDLVGGLGRYDLEKLEGFKPEFLSGLVTERYTVDLKEGFESAKVIMDGAIRQLCCRDIGGDHQRLEMVRTQHVGVTFKHLLLPTWLAAYRYRDVPYRILVNARSGNVVGTRPYSWLKITLLVVAIVIAVALLVVVLSLASGSQHGSNSGHNGRVLVMEDVRTIVTDRQQPGPSPCHTHLRAGVTGLSAYFPSSSAWPSLASPPSRGARKDLSDVTRSLL